MVLSLRFQVFSIVLISPVGTDNLEVHCGFVGFLEPILNTALGPVPHCHIEQCFYSFSAGVHLIAAGSGVELARLGVLGEFMKRLFSFFVILSYFTLPLTARAEPRIDRQALSDEVLASLCAGDVANTDELNLALTVCSSAELLRNLTQIQLLLSQQKEASDKVKGANEKHEKTVVDIYNNVFFLLSNGSGAGLAGISTFKTIRAGIGAYQEISKLKNTDLSNFKIPESRDMYISEAKSLLKSSIKRGAFSGGVSILTLLGSIGSSMGLYNNYVQVEVMASELPAFQKDLADLEKVLKMHQSKLSGMAALKEALK